MLLFILRKMPFSHLDFRRWQSALVITIIGFSIGLDPHLWPGSEMPAIPLWLTLSGMVSATWAGFFVILGVLRWWMRRGGRWNGEGSLFNLVAASWLMTNALGVGFAVMGVSPLLTLPLWLYSLWVGANALSGAIPRASISYSIGGIVIGLVPAVLVSAIVFAAVGIALAVFGVAPLPPDSGPAGMA